MSLSAPRQRSAWGALERHYRKMANRHLRQLFAEDRERSERFAVEAAGVYLDYSKNRITDETVKLLLQLAQESGLRERIDAMFRGEKINVTENRAVLHVAELVRLRSRRALQLHVHDRRRTGTRRHRGQASYESPRAASDHPGWDLYPDQQRSRAGSAGRAAARAAVPRPAGAGAGYVRGHSGHHSAPSSAGRSDHPHP